VTNLVNTPILSFQDQPYNYPPIYVLVFLVVSFPMAFQPITYTLSTVTIYLNYIFLKRAYRRHPEMPSVSSLSTHRNSVHALWFCRGLTESRFWAEPAHEGMEYQQCTEWCAQVVRTPAHIREGPVLISARKPIILRACMIFFSISWIKLITIFSFHSFLNSLFTDHPSIWSYTLYIEAIERVIQLLLLLLLLLLIIIIIMIIRHVFTGL
jgi:hypothetical protein